MFIKNPRIWFTYRIFLSKTTYCFHNIKYSIVTIILFFAYFRMSLSNGCLIIHLMMVVMNCIHNSFSQYQSCHTFHIYMSKSMIIDLLRVKLFLGYRHFYAVDYFFIIIQAPRMVMSVDSLDSLCIYRTQRKRKTGFSVLRTTSLPSIQFLLC